MTKEEINSVYLFLLIDCPVKNFRSRKISEAMLQSEIFLVTLILASTGLCSLLDFINGSIQMIPDNPNEPQGARFLLGATSALKGLGQVPIDDDDLKFSRLYAKPSIDLREANHSSLTIMYRTEMGKSRDKKLTHFIAFIVRSTNEASSNFISRIRVSPA